MPAAASTERLSSSEWRMVWRAGSSSVAKCGSRDVPQLLKRLEPPRVFLRTLDVPHKDRTRVDSPRAARKPLRRSRWKKSGADEVVNGVGELLDMMPRGTGGAGPPLRKVRAACSKKPGPTPPAARATLRCQRVQQRLKETLRRLCTRAENRRLSCLMVGHAKRSANRVLLYKIDDPRSLTPPRTTHPPASWIDRAQAQQQPEGDS